MRALTHAVGVRIEDETALTDRLDQVAQRVTARNAITKRGRRDQAPLGFVNEEIGVRAGVIGEGLQLGLQCQQVIFQRIFKAATLEWPRLPRLARR